MRHLVLIVSWFFFAMTVQSSCDPSLCKPEWVGYSQIGDNVCDISCFSQACNFDSSEGVFRPSASDCFDVCLELIQCSSLPDCNIEDHLGNGVCEAELAVPECGWDMGDCGYCNLNCEDYTGFEGMLGDGECQVQCLTQACGNDGGDCEESQCSAGCYPYMVDDGICEEACHTAACGWDSFDCDCSPGCTSALLSNDACDELCDLKECAFDSGKCVMSIQGECASGCFAAMRGDFTCDSACFNDACEWDNGDCECAPGCFSSEIGSCKVDCQVVACAANQVDLSLPCVASDPSYFACNYTIVSESCLSLCSQCGYSVKYEVSCGPDRCPEYAMDPVFPQCVCSPDRTTKWSPRVVYVDSTADADTADGTLSNPFATLSAALGSIYERYVDVRLFPGRHSINYSTHLINNIMFHNWDFTLPIPSLKRLTISSLFCKTEECSRATLVSDHFNMPFFALRGPLDFEVMNVDFTAAFDFDLCLDPGACPNLNDLFAIDGVRLKFENVTFQRYHRAMSSIILASNSAVTLINVDFIDILLRTYNYSFSVIRCDGNVDLHYTSGRVALLNNGKSFSTKLNNCGFLAAENSRVLIDGVKFENNFVASIDPNYGSLLLLINCWQSLVRNSEFAFNMGQAGTVLHYQSTLQTDFSPDYDTAVTIANTAMVIENCTFRNNSGVAGSTLLFEFAFAPLNVSIRDCTFFSELAEQYGVVVARSSNLQNFHDPRVKFATTASGRQRKVRYPPQTLSMRNVTFVRCIMGLTGLMFFERITNLELSDVVIKELPGSGDVVSTSLQVLKTIDGAHTPSNVILSPMQPCRFVLNIVSAGFVSITHMLYANQNCSLGATITAVNINISDLELQLNTGYNIQGAILHLEAQTAIQLTGLISDGNSNPNPFSSGTIYITAPSVLVSASTFRGNSAWSGAALYIKAINATMIRECLFEGNSVDALAGAVAIQLPENSTLAITSCVFRSNSAATFGGAFCVLSQLLQFSLFAVIADTVFETNSATVGSAFYVSKGAEFVPGSLFVGCRFVVNRAGENGGCYFDSFIGEIAVRDCVFERNFGSHGAALFFRYSARNTTASHRILMFGTVLRGNNGLTIAEILASTNPTEVICGNISCISNSGTCLYFDYANATRTDSEFRLNSGESGSVFQMQSTTAHFERSQFDSNQADYLGGAGLVNSHSYFSCRACFFTNNTSMWQGGALFIEQSSYVSLKDSTFYRNKASNGGFALFVFACEKESLIELSTFRENSGSGFGVVVAMTSVLRLKGCEFSENHSENVMGGVMTSQSTLAIDSCAFTNQSGISGTFLYQLQSNVTIADSVFRNGTASDVGSAIMLMESRAVVNSSIFDSLQADLGGGVYIQSLSHIELVNCSFSRIASAAADRSAVIVSQSVFRSWHSVFREYSQGAIAASEADVFIGNCSFSNGTGRLQSAVGCSDCSSLRIEGSQFERLNASGGAAVYIQRTNNGWSIVDSSFIGNRGELFGAVYSEGWSGVILNCSFTDNSADGPLGKGGAIYVSSPLHIAHNVFDRNAARVKGGAICWEGPQPTIEFNKFSGNTAEYGNDVASYASSLILAPTSNSTLKSVASGQTSNSFITLLLLDHYGQVVTSDNESSAQMMSSSIGTSIAGIHKATAQKGVFVFREYEIVSAPGTNTSVFVATQSVPAPNNSVTLHVEMRECGIGEALTNGQCTICAKGTYSLDPTGSCKDCPSEAACLGNYSMVPRAGYWRSNPFTDKFFDCPNRDSCLGFPSSSNPIGECAEGYEGNQCSGCQVSYFRWGRIFCSKCQAAETRIALQVLGLLLLALGLVLLVKSVLLSAKNPDSVYSMYVKVFVNYVQIVMLFGAFQLSWPSLVMELFNAQETLGAFPEYLLPTNCLFEGETEEEAYYLKLQLVSFAQPVLVAASSLVWCAIAACNKSLQSIKNQLVCSAIVVFFLAYPSVIRITLDSFHCYEIDPGEYWLAGFNIRCWTRSHSKYSLGLALPCVVVWGIAVPGLVLLALKKQRIHLNFSEWKVRYGFLVLGFRTEYYGWEFVVISRKLLLIACIVLLPRISLFSQVLPCLSVLIFSVFLQQHYQPCKEPGLNSLETHSLVISSLTLYCGLVYYTGILGSVARIVLFAIIALLNLHFTAKCGQRILVFGFFALRRRFLPERRAEKQPQPPQN